MKTTKLLLLSLGLATVFTACGHRDEENPTGSWTSAAPMRVTENVAGASSATKSLSFDFIAPVGDAAGDVVLTADYDVTVPYVTDSVSNKNTYQVTATIKGTWQQDKHDDDEYMLSFDSNTLSVNGTDAPELGPVTDEFINSLAQFTSIEDVKVTNERTHMTFETNHPDIKYHFVKK